MVLETCCLCGNKYPEGKGNNPDPVLVGTTAQCCDECNRTKVIPARIRLILKGERKCSK